MLGEGEDFSRADDGEGDLLAEVGIGEAADGGHGGDGLGDGGWGDDDAGAGAWEAEFGEAVGEDDVVVPVGGGVVEDDVGEGGAVGVVDDEWDVVLFGEGGES